MINKNNKNGTKNEKKEKNFKKQSLNNKLLIIILKDPGTGKNIFIIKTRQFEIEKFAHGLKSYLSF